MKLNRSLIRAASAMIAVAMIAVVSDKTSAQETRPRYNSGQYAEPSWTLPPDTVISVQMNGTLSSRTARVGDKFTATVTVPVYVNGRTVIPAGSIVEGRVTQVTPAKRMNRSGTIGIDFDDVLFPNGSRAGLVGSLTSDDPETRRRIDDESRVSGERNKRPAVFIGGGGAIGAVLGGIAGGGKGAVLGGVAGAGAGVAGILLSKGEEAQVPSGTPFGVQIKQALIIRESFISEGAPAADRSADQPADRTADRPDRPEPVGSQPDHPDRPIASRAEPEMRTEVDRSSGSAPELPLSSPEMVRRAQGALKEQGYYEGEADGVMSPRTASALRAYQREHNLQETGDLDPQTAKRLGIVGATSVERTPERPRETRTDNVPSDSVMANVLSASANRTQEGAISVLINTQANTGGWRWFGEQVVNGDTLEVYARAIRPTGMVTQALTRGRIELTVRDGVEYVRRVVIHSAGGDQVVALGGRTDAGLEPSAPSGNTASSASSLQRKAEELLAEYQRVYGVRMTGTGVEVDNASQYKEAEIELLFAIDSFANSAQLYARLATSLRDRQSMRGATLAMARQARRTDRVISTTTSRAADSLAARWDSVRQDVLKLMQTYNISSSEVEN
jgi:peptidoglycan hydrolase-like protein with peptidoglycan-binding domain